MTTYRDLAADLLTAYRLPEPVCIGLHHTVAFQTENLARALQGVIDEATARLAELNAGGLPDLHPGYSGALGSNVENAHVAAAALKAVLDAARQTAYLIEKEDQ